MSALGIAGSLLPPVGGATPEVKGEVSGDPGFTLHQRLPDGECSDL